MNRGLLVCTTGLDHVCTRSEMGSTWDNPNLLLSDVPGPTWGGLLRELQCLFSDGTRRFSLDVLREFLFINFVRAVAMHPIVDTSPMGWLLGLAFYRLDLPREVEGFH
jgi:hypothetical protein